MKPNLPLPLILSLFILGCGGGDTSTSTSPDTSNTLTGVFIDAPVKGLTYTSSPSGNNGTTNAQGEFNYVEGDTVSFAMGDIDFGETKPDATKQVKVTQLPKGIQVAQLLQTLDNNADENFIDISDISIPSAVKDAIEEKLQAINDNSDILTAAELLAIKNSNTAKLVLMGKTDIVSKAAAVEHVNKQIGQQGLTFNASELSNTAYVETSLLFNKMGNIYAFDASPANTFSLINVGDKGNYYAESQAAIAKTYSIKASGDLELTFLDTSTSVAEVCTVTKMAEDAFGVELKYQCIINGDADNADIGLLSLLKVQPLQADDLDGRSYTYISTGSSTSFEMQFSDGKFTTTSTTPCVACTYTAGDFTNSVKIVTGDETIEFLLLDGNLDDGNLITLTYSSENDFNTVEIIDITNGNTLTPVHVASNKAYQAPNWVPNVFAAASTFKDYCEAPRSGNDHNGDPYADKQGSYAAEKFWLRSWSNETYLWYDEIVDQDPTGSNTPQQYFNTLKTSATTATGQPKDKYHYYEDTAEFNEYAESGVSFSYGLRYKLIRTSPPRKGIIAYVVDGSPAAKAGIARGDEYVEINGEDIENGSDIGKLNDGLFPTDESPTHSFKFRRLNGDEYEVTMTAEDLTSPSVLINDYSSLSDANGKRYAYLMLNTFNTHKAEADLYYAFQNIAQHEVDTGNQINELILDLRYNGGGYVYISSQLAYAIAGNNIPTNSYYKRSTFNDKNLITNPVTGRTITSTPFYSITYGDSGEVGYGLSFNAMNLERVFVLSTERTCSASESLINGLMGIGVDVVLIGDTTCGKPYGFYPTDNCGTTYNTIQYKSANYTGFGDYSDGFIPTDTSNPQLPYIQGCVVEDDFTHQLGDSAEALLNTALNYDTVGCPAVPASALGINPLPQSFGASLMNDSRMQFHEMKHNSAILIDRSTGAGQ